MNHFIALAALLVVATPCAAQTMRVVATDYAFRAPARTRPGVNRIVLVNRGHDLHHLVISRLPDTLDAKRAYQLIVAKKPVPDDVRDIGGPNAAAPGDSSSAWVPLARGRYMLSCWIVAPDGTFHILKGMFAQLDVSGEPLEGVSIPKPNVTITAREYSLDVSHPLGAGTFVIEFANEGRQDHDLEIVRLDSANARTVARRFEGDTTALRGATLVGGVSGVGPGRKAWTRVTLARGRYALFCFVPDEHDGKSHFRHGMLREIRIP